MHKYNVTITWVALHEYTKETVNSWDKKWGGVQSPPGRRDKDGEKLDNIDKKAIIIQERPSKAPIFIAIENMCLLRLCLTDSS